jgi:hypothetical protein
MNPSIQRRAPCCAQPWPPQPPVPGRPQPMRRRPGPAKAVTLIVPFPAGGGTDAFARPMGGAVRAADRQATDHRQPGRRWRHTWAPALPPRPHPTAYTLFMGAVHHAIAPSDVPQAGLRPREGFRAADPRGQRAAGAGGESQEGHPRRTSRSSWLTSRHIPGKLNYASAGARVPRTIWRANCSSSRRTPSSPTFPTAGQARRCRT